MDQGRRQIPTAVDRNGNRPASFLSENMVASPDAIKFPTMGAQYFDKLFCVHLEYTTLKLYCQGDDTGWNEIT